MQVELESQNQRICNWTIDSAKGSIQPFPSVSPSVTLFSRIGDWSIAFFLILCIKLGFNEHNAFFISNAFQKQPSRCVLKICCKFTGLHPCRSAISIKLQSNFIEITLRHVCSPVNLLDFSEHVFVKTPLTAAACFFSAQPQYCLTFS